MKQVYSIPEYCYPIDYCVDHGRLLESINILLSRLGLDMDMINQECLTKFAYTVNLTHLPHLVGPSRWSQYAGNHPSVARQGVREVDFTTHLDEMSDLYLGQVLKDLYQQHPGPFQGRVQLIWLGANQRYPMHRDPHAPNRYHIPIITNASCYWILEEPGQDTVTLHMPADGRVWYLNPVVLRHTFVNDSDRPRLHVLLTNGL